MPDNAHHLAARVGALLQDERAKRRLSQAQVAGRAGTSQQRVSLVERGATQPTTALLDRLFTALDLQIRVDPEPLGADCDTEIEKFERLSEDERAEWFSYYGYLLDRLADLPYVLTGRFGAFLHGVPINPTRLDLAVAHDDLDRFAAWLQGVNCQRWNERWLDYGGATVDPREPGPMRWMIGFYELRLDVTPAAPAAVTVCCAERPVRVRPLPDIEREYSDVRRLTRRVRARAAAPTPG
ncbi:MAG TPA: helix-turn-helix domain-containing protein [Planosporangium sp.]|jgi:transcriptional regulator with XRE-family HTH domain|nr:helix-turn-helix domain-containing protein [Planosporangium sp.]